MSTLTRDEIRHLCGDISDHRTAEIIATGGSVKDLEVALAWMAGESDVMGEERRPLSGAAAQIYEILVAGQEWQEEDAPSTGGYG